MEKTMKVLTFEEITEKHKRQAQQFLDEHPPKEGSEAPLEFWLINRGLRIIEQAEANISHYKNSSDKYAKSCIFLSEQRDKLQEENQQLNAEIERLKQNIELLAICKKDLPQKTTEVIKAEAVKELLEKLTKEYGHYTLDTEICIDAIFCSIKHIVKEMVGDNNGAD